MWAVRDMAVMNISACVFCTSLTVSWVKVLETELPDQIILPELPDQNFKAQLPIVLQKCSLL